MKALKVAIVVPDDRDERHQYEMPEPYFGTAVTALLAGFAETPEVEIHIVSCTHRPMSAPARLGKNLFYHSVVVPKWGWLRGGYVGCIRAARRKLKEISPAIVHGQGTERYCALSAGLSGFPNLITIHGNLREIARILKPRPFSYLWLASRSERVAIPVCGGVVCITNYTRRLVERIAKRTWIQPNAVDSSFFDIEASATASERPVVLCVGDIGPRKNQNAFIRSLDSVANQLQFQLVFLGRIDDAEPYSREFRGLLQSRPWSSYEGFTDREKLKAFFQKASVLALPSLEDNCPMVVLEAMAAGLPVMASRVGGVPDLIQSDKTGLLCDPAEPASFAAAAQRLIEGLSFRRLLAGRAKQHALQTFHPSVVARRHVEIYRDILNGVC